MSTYYEAGVRLALSHAGFTKEAGIREFLKFLGTGRSTAFHGTSRGSAEAIKAGKGIIPRHRRGVVDVIKEELNYDPTKKKQLAFLTRSKPEAKAYAGQQGMVEATGTTAPFLGKEIGVRIGEEGRGALPAELKRVWQGIKGARSGKRHGVLKAQYPAREFTPVRNPEGKLRANSLKDLIGGTTEKGVSKVWPDIAERTLQTFTGFPYRKTFGLRASRRGAAAMPTKYIQGTPGYQRVTFPEVKQHFQHAIKNPKETATEALRNLTGWQHVP